jgi:hypothetical protein
MMSRTEFLAGDSEAPAPPNTLSWSKTGVNYSPDTHLWTDTPVVAEGSTVTLHWTIAPTGGTVSCTHTPALPAWGPDAAGFPRSGTSNIVVNADTNYQLTCVETPALTPPTPLTSVASMNVDTYFVGCSGEGCPVGGGGGGDGGVD